MKEFKVKFNAINSVRAELMGISTILVLLNHSKCFEWNGKFEIIKKIFSEGGIGVDIFLLLSGIGLYYSFSKGEDRKEFYKRRLIRVIPIYLPLAIIFLGIIECLGNFNLLNYFLRVTSISYWINGDGIYWYVSYILVFYLIYPYIYKYILKRNISPVVSIALMFLVEAVVLLLFNQYYVGIHLALSRLPITILACYLGRYAHEEKKVNIVGIAALLIPFILLRGIRIIYVPEMNEALVTFLVKTANMFFVIFFCYFYYGIDRFLFPFVKKLLRFFGRYSLEIYIIHMSLLTIVLALYNNVHVLFYFGIIVPVTLMLSCLYQWLIKSFFFKSMKNTQ